MAPTKGKTEDAFLAAVDERLDHIGAKLDKAAAAVSGAKRRSWWAVAIAVVAALLGASVAHTVHQQSIDRKASRIAVCKNTNDSIEQARAGAQALLTVGQLSRAQRAPETPEQTAQRQQLTKTYLEAQHFGYDQAKEEALAVTLDCGLFAKDPAKARAKLERERP